MSEATHVYTPPPTASANAVPAEVARYLDGTDLLAKTQAVRLSTVDSAGWPHAALLSAGDMVVLPSERIRFALFPQSTTVANARRENYHNARAGWWHVRNTTSCTPAPALFPRCAACLL
jgi:hypothetical protein